MDDAFGAEQVAVFEADRAKSREITLAEWEGRSPVQKLIDGAFGLLRSQM